MAFPSSPLRSGQRLGLFGRSGSGKTYLAKWIILQTPNLRWLILDSKHDPNFDAWFPREGLPAPRQIMKWWRKHGRIVVRPKPEENDPRILDLWLSVIHDGLERFGLLIDEGYQVTRGVQPGPGLTGLITRGRIRGQTIIVGSQRPAWLPRFVFSEANGYIVMNLALRDDRERVADMVSDRYHEAVLTPLPPREWLYYDIAADRLSHFRPVTIIRQDQLDRLAESGATSPA